MRLLIASCKALPSFEKDDRFLWAEFERRGISFDVVPWDESIDLSAFGACLIRTTWDYVERWTEFRDWSLCISQQMPLFNSFDVVQWNLNKRYLQFLSEKGVPIAPTYWLSESQSLVTIMESFGESKGFIKPVIGACAVDTFRFSQDNIQEAQHFLDICCERQEMMVQPYLQRVETEGEFSAIFFAGAFSHAVQKIPVSGDYRVQDDYGAFDRGIEPPLELLELGKKALSHIPFPWLYARVDALRMDDGRWVLNELEMIEPSLFFRHSARAPSMLCDALVGAWKNHC